MEDATAILLLCQVTSVGRKAHSYQSSISSPSCPALPAPPPTPQYPQSFSPARDLEHGKFFKDTANILKTH